MPTCLAVRALGVVVCGGISTAFATGTLTSLQPAYLSPILIQGDANALPLSAYFVNGTGTTVNVFAYLQDDASCPQPPSSHAWLLLTNQIQGNIISDGVQHLISGAVPFDSTVQPLGKYATNICLVEQGVSNFTHVIPVKLQVVAGGPVPLSGVLTSIKPNLVGAAVPPNDTASVPLLAMFQNNTGGTVSIFGYVQDDPACPLTQSSHAWIPLSTPISGSILSDNLPHPVGASIPLDATGISSGTFRTNICLAQQGSVNVVTAIPVKLVVAAADDIFQDGFE